MKIPHTTMSLLAALCMSPLAIAEPTPTAATDGVGFDNPAAGVTDITAPDNAIIDYSSFNIRAGETVNFIQPSAASRVLNRINSNTPSQIDGNLNANGIVYLVNPAGVQFGPTAIIDAAGIYAAAGSLSDTDFLAANDRFTNIAGSVSNQGIIRADLIAALVGQSVNNTGTIAVPNGTVVLASGEQVLMGSPRGGLMVSVDATPTANGEGGVTQDGTIQAKHVSLVAGDLYSLALTSSQAAAPLDPNAITLPQADTDGDGDIDNDDINTAYANFTGPLAPGTGTKTQADGDADGDGDVDNTDIGILFILFTGPITIPPDVADDFNLRVVEDLEFVAITEAVNLSEADLSILRDQLGIAARPPSTSERIAKAQARALYNDLRTDTAPNADGSLPIANTRLDADVVREALRVYRDRLAKDGIDPAQRTTEIKQALDTAYANYRTAAEGNTNFDPAAFSAYINEQDPALINTLDALNDMRELTLTMGLSELEKKNSERIIIERSRPEDLTYGQMRALLDAASAVTLAPTSEDAGDAG